MAVGVEDRDWFREDAKRRAAMLDRKSRRSSFWLVERWFVIHRQASTPVWQMALVWIALAALLFLLFSRLIA